MNRRATLVRERDWHLALARRSDGEEQATHRQMARGLTKMIGTTPPSKRHDRRAQDARVRKAAGRLRAAAERRRIAEGRPVVPRPAPAQPPISPPPTATHRHARENARRLHHWLASPPPPPAAEEPAP